MSKKLIACGLSIIFFLSGCGSRPDDKYDGKVDRTQVAIREVAKMPDKPIDYQWKDYKAIALELDEILYEFAENPEYQVCDFEGENPTYAPLGYWTEAYNSIYKGRGFGIPSYIGHVGAGGGSIALSGGGTPEGITTLASVYGASLAGIDKSKQKFIGSDGKEYEYNFVDMLKAFYSDEGFILNRMNGSTGYTFWYEIYPQILFARIMNMYEMDPDSKEIILGGADLWIDALDYFKDKGNGKFWYTSFDFVSMKPVLGMWAEPANGGVAFLLMNAFQLTGDQKYLDAAKEYMDFCQEDIRNPNYEILTDYLPYAAAYANFVADTNYDIEKFVNFIFDADDDARPTGIVRGTWGDYSADGLMAYDNWGNTHEDSYAFVMNTYHIASTVIPMLRYDSRFADSVGKWLVNMTSNARIFYRDEVDEQHRTQPDNVACDPNGVVAYEGTSQYKRFSTAYGDQYDRSVSPYAMGDPTMRGWGKTDFGIYGSSHVGILGGLINQTNVEAVLQVDITKADSFKRKGDYQEYLYYNPYDENKNIKIDLDSKYVLLDTITQKIVAEGKGEVWFELPAKSSMILALIPTDVSIKSTDGNLYAGDILISKATNAEVKIEGSLTSRMVVEDGYCFNLSAQAFNGHTIEEMTVYLGNKEIYRGKPLKSFEIDYSKLGDEYFTAVAASIREGGRSIQNNIITYQKNLLEAELRFEVKTDKSAYASTMIRIRKG